MKFFLNFKIVLNPKLALGDFETASTNAIKFHFPNFEIKGCWFHLRKAIFRRVVRIGLKAHYNQREYGDFVKTLDALAFVPTNRMNEALLLVERVKPDDTKCDDILNEPGFKVCSL